MTCHTGGRPRAAISAESNSDWFDTSLGSLVGRDEAAALLPLLGPVTGRRALDAGTGDGRLAIGLAARGAEVVGIDVAGPIVRLAASRAATATVPLSVAAGRVEALPFDSESFDLVVAVTVLCFVETAGAAAREMARVTRPGGRVVLGELGAWSPWAVQRRLRGLIGAPRWKGVRFRTRSGLEGLLTGAGLDPVDWSSAVFYPRSLRLAIRLRRLEAALRGRTTIGAAFIAVAGEKPGRLDPADRASGLER